jgi:ribosome maturation factor RimP
MTTDQAGSRPDDIAALLAPTLHDLGFDLVQVKLIGGGQRRTLQVMAEPLDPAAGMTVDDCAEISHAVSAVLDVADPIAGAYTLEVSSPGIDRPLVRPTDFVRFAGHEIKAELDQPHEGRKRLAGRLEGLDKEENVVILIDGAEWRVPFARVKKAKLVLTDALIASALKGSAGAHEVRE